MKKILNLLLIAYGEKKNFLFVIFLLSFIDGIFFYGTTFLISKFLANNVAYGPGVFLFYFIGIYCLNLLTSYGIRRYGEYLALSSAEAVKTYFFEKILHSNASQLLPHSGFLLSLIQKFADIYPQLIFQTYWWFCRALIVASSLFYLIWRHSPMIFMLDIILVISFIILSQILSRKILPLNLHLNIAKGQYVRSFADFMQNLLSIKSLKIEKFIFKKLSKEQNNVWSAINDQQNMHAFRWLILHAIFGIILISSMGVFFYQSAQGKIDSALYVVIVSFFINLRSDLNNLAENLKLLREQIGYLDQIETYALQNYTKSKASQNQQEINIKDLIIDLPNGNFQLKVPRFKLKNNERVLICGPSGSGKSVFLKFLCGVFEPQNSVILDFDQSNIAYFGQEVDMFNFSFAENITFGKDVNEKILSKVVEELGLSKLVSNHHNDLNFLIEEKGKNISTGQKTRINIARAYFSNQKILLLDEAFAHLDKQNSALMVNFIKSHFKEKSLVFVSHQDVFEPEYFDRIYEIRSGVLLENTSK